MAEEYAVGDRFKIELTEVSPTQMTIGHREVEYRKRKLLKKRRKWKEDPERWKKYLKEKAGDVILGPDGSVFMVDGHHHTRALWEIGESATYVTVNKNWSDLSWREFWRRMEANDRERGRPWVHLYDANGQRHPKEDLPPTLGKLRDDPLRSIVFFLVRLGIIRKDENFPYYGEFDIVEWLRGKIAVKDSAGRWRYWKATQEAAYLVSKHSEQSAELPGQRYLSPRHCRKILGGLSHYLPN